IKRHLEAGQVDVNLEELEKVPEKKVNIVKIAGYGIPVLLASLVIWIILTQGSSSIEKLLDMFLWWFLINGSLAGAGAAIARAHPLSILTAFVAAPFTSLNPAVAAGWFAGLVEAKLRMPTVRDFQELSKLETFKDLFKNRVVRLLMIVALANLGSTIGTLVAIPYVVKIGLIG
ncbi:MAG: TraB family protein, partial [Thermoplasmata archaeon]|nr:TraB family protein [Thermoplasmata archaeon]